MAFERVKTGITGLDKIIGGGIPKGFSVLVTGFEGTGKSILAMQTAANIARLGKKALYISFEQNENEIRQCASDFGWTMNKNLVLMHMRPNKIEDIGMELVELKKKGINPDFVVIDSLSTLISLSDEENTRQNVYNIITILKEKGITSILITEIPQDSKWMSRDRYSEFACDGVIKLEADVVGEQLERNMRVVKMRNTPIDGGRHELNITKKGLSIK